MQGRYDLDLYDWAMVLPPPAAAAGTVFDRRLLSVFSALCPPAPLKSLIFWRYTNQIIIIIIIC